MKQTQENQLKLELLCHDGEEQAIDAVSSETLLVL